MTAHTNHHILMSQIFKSYYSQMVFFSSCQRCQIYFFSYNLFIGKKNMEIQLDFYRKKKAKLKNMTYSAIPPLNLEGSKFSMGKVGSLCFLHSVSVSSGTEFPVSFLCHSLQNESLQVKAPRAGDSVIQRLVLDHETKTLVSVTKTIQPTALISKKQAADIFNSFLTKKMRSCSDIPESLITQMHCLN